MQPGDVLDERFVVEQAAEKGGLGVVFRGWDLEAEAAVAIKVLAADLSPTDVERFHREASLLAELRLPGIVRHVHSGTSIDGEPYLVMQWLDGETVARRLADVGFDAAEAVALVRAICEPLGALHARGLVHRDVKPENVFLGESIADVTLIDLGLARAEDPPVRLTATGVVLGTPGYMAPEQIRGDRAIDARADVFALGCMLYECLTGYAAFAGDNFLAVRTKIVLATPPRLATLCPEAPPALDDLVHAMIAKLPDDRPPSARAVGDRLRDLGGTAGPRRAWNTARLTATVALDDVAGVVLVRGAPIDALRDAVAPFGGTVAALSDGDAVVTLPRVPRSDLARRLARCALALRDRVPDAHVVISTGAIDQVALLLEQAMRASVVGGDGGFVVADHELGGELSDFHIDPHASGWRLRCEHDVKTK